MVKLQEVKYKFVPRERVRERERVVVEFKKPSRTQQQYKDECDINRLMAKYKANGMIPGHLQQPLYGDFTKVPDYQAAMQIVVEADALFASLSAEIRSRFDNDPAKFLAFCEDEKNGDELIAMGLREAPKAPPGPVQVQVVNPAPAEPEAPK